MPEVRELKAKTLLEQAIASNCYLLIDKNILTPAIPLETGFYLYLYSAHPLTGGLYISSEMIVRWAILYELCLLMESADKKNFKLHIKNSLPFVSEWLDDLMLFNWNCFEGDLVDWQGKKLEDYTYILNRCKRCCDKFEEKKPITSLHYNRRDEKDCSRRYNNKSLRKATDIAYEISKVLREVGLKTESSANENDELKKMLRKAKIQLSTIAKKWHNHLNGEKLKNHYNNPSLSPLVEIKNYNDLYYPEGRTKEYKKLKELMRDDTYQGDTSTIFNELYSSYRLRPLTYVDLVRRYFYKCAPLKLNYNRTIRQIN